MKELDLYIGDKIIIEPNVLSYTFSKSQIDAIVKSDFDYNIYSKIVDDIRKDYPYWHDCAYSSKVISYFENGYCILESSNGYSFSLFNKVTLGDMLCKGRVKIDMKHRRLNKLEYFGI